MRSEFIGIAHLYYIKIPLGSKRDFEMAFVFFSFSNSGHRTAYDKWTKHPHSQRFGGVTVVKIYRNQHFRKTNFFAPNIILRTTIYQIPTKKKSFIKSYWRRWQ